MSRVELIEAEQAPLLAKPYYAADGSASPLTRVLAQVPELLEPTLPFVNRVLGETAVDERTKEIVILRVSALNGCRYCTDTHTAAAWDAGLSRDETAALCGTPAELGERDRAVVEWSDAVNATPDAIPEDVVARAREHLSEPELVELTLVAAATAMLNHFCTALEVPVSEPTRARLEAPA